MAKDPYRYFRIEAQELLDGLSEGLLALEKGANAELLRRLLRLAHTLKGASRVVKRTDIGDLAHKLEDVLSPLRDDVGQVERLTIDTALQLLDQIREQVILLAKGPEAANQSAPTQAATNTAEQEIAEIFTDSEQTIRISVSDLDKVLESAFEAHTAAASLSRQSAKTRIIVDEASDLVSDLRVDSRSPEQQKRISLLTRLLGELQTTNRDALERTDRVVLELAELRALSSELRLVPAQTLMNDLERVVRDAARELGKDVAVFATGTETHIDAHVLAGLRNALIHLVRNCVAHGIEDRAVRSSSGKSAEGRIDIRIERRGHNVCISCRDDGCGLDLKLLRRVAVERNLATAERADAMSEVEFGRLLLKGGLSTSTQISDVSGRGVGLDAVRHCMEALKGEIKLHSTPGRGTVVELLAPLSLSSMPALSVQVDGARFFLPLGSVRQVLRIPSSDVARDMEGERIVVADQVLPFLSLRRALGRPGAELAEKQSAVVIETEGRRAALGVDRMGAAPNIVVRSLPVHAAADPIISGAAFDDDGNPVLVLAPGPLIEAAASGLLVADAPVEEETPPLLVIDDSLTTRMLEQSILESAGYQVDVAVSAEDGLEKARKRKYGLFIVDVEMPGMSGFEFIETIRKDAELGATPAILVTSRGEAGHKLRGKQVGAQAYIVKSEFDQAVLIDTIRRLLR